MAIINNAPTIDKILPPIEKNGNTYKLYIPFTHNIAMPNYSSMLVKIFGITGNNILKYAEISIDEVEIFDGYIQKVVTDWPSTYKLLPFSFYRVLLAYVENEILGSYSNVGVAKLIDISDISCTIEGLASSTTITNLKTKYNGVYTNSSSDLSEKVLRYLFKIYEGEAIDNTKLYYSTGWQKHSDVNTIITNNELISKDIFELTKSLKINTTYTLQYEIETINGFIMEAHGQIKDNNLVKPEIEAFLVPYNNYDDGYISVMLKPNTFYKNAIPKSMSGTFSLMRSCEKDLYTDWVKILEFTLKSQVPDVELWRDYCIEQGVSYKYAIQTDSKGSYMGSAKLASEPILANYEDIFLFDGDRLLKLKYNPKVTNFKINTVEAKTDTLGSKYPFLSRNGYVGYTTFALNALISLLEDEQGLFRNGALINATFIDNLFSSGIDVDKSGPNTSTALLSNNFKAERSFKLDVLTWLNNGKPKLFKSAAEGMYIVTLLGLGLTPMDLLGRMLHSVAGTAYEIANCDNESLQKYQLLKGENITFNDYNIIEYNFRNLASIETEKDNNNIDKKIFPANTNIASFNDTLCYIRLPNIIPVEIECIKMSKNTQIDYYLNCVDINNLNTATLTYYITDYNKFILNNFNIDHTNESSWTSWLVISFAANEDRAYSKIKIKYKIDSIKHYKNLLSVDTSWIPLKLVSGDIDKCLIGGELFNMESILEPREHENNTYTKTSVMNIDLLLIRRKEYKLTTNEADINPNYWYYDSETNEKVSMDYNGLLINCGISTFIRINNLIIKINGTEGLKKLIDYGFTLVTPTIAQITDLTGITCLQLSGDLIANLSYSQSVGTYQKYE